MEAVWAVVTTGGRVKRFSMLQRVAGRMGATRTRRRGSQRAYRQRAGSHGRRAACRQRMATARSEARRLEAMSHAKPIWRECMGQDGGLFLMD
jgi:hypothetical protein